MTGLTTDKIDRASNIAWTSPLIGGGLYLGSRCVEQDMTRPLKRSRSAVSAVVGCLTYQAMKPTMQRYFFRPGAPIGTMAVGSAIHVGVSAAVTLATHALFARFGKR